MTGLAAAKRSRHPAKQAARPRRAHPEHCSFPPRRFPLRPRYPIRVFPHPQGTARRRKSRRGPRRLGVGGRGRRALPAAACVEGCPDGYGIARFPPAWLPAADGPGLFPFAFEAPPSRGWRKGRFRLFIPCGTCEERRFPVEVRAWETLKRLCDRSGKMSRKKKTIFILFLFFFRLPSYPLTGTRGANAFSCRCACPVQHERAPPSRPFAGLAAGFRPAGRTPVFLAFLFFLLHSYHWRLERRFSLSAQGCRDSCVVRPRRVNCEGRRLACATVEHD